jgi:universal stress protein E
MSRRGLKRLFIGNSAERLLDDLHCDVLVVKPPGYVAPVPRRRRGVYFLSNLPIA